MLYIRKKPSKTEREELKRWEEKHRRETEAYERSLTKEKREKLNADFWAMRVKEQEQLRALRNTTDHIPSLKNVTIEPITHNPFADLDVDELEKMKRREAVAQERIRELKNRVAPAYNKGNYVLYTDGMLDDLKAGKHRRR